MLSACACASSSLQPPGDRPREARLGHRPAQQRLHFGLQRLAVQRGRPVALDLLERPALHEIAPDLEDRRQRVMRAAQGRQFIADAEQLADEALQMRRERDDKLGLFQPRQRVRRASRGHQPRAEARVGRPQGIQEQPVQPNQPLAIVEILEGKPVAQNQRVSLHGNARVPCWWRLFRWRDCIWPAPRLRPALFCHGGWRVTAMAERGG